MNRTFARCAPLILLFCLAPWMTAAAMQQAEAPPPAGATAADPAADGGDRLTIAETLGYSALRLEMAFDGLDDLTVFLLRPNTFRAEGHKVLIYFVGGGQEEVYAQAALNSHVVREAAERGYVIVVPAAPCYYCTFVAEGGEAYFPALFESLREMIPMSEDRFHMMGFSNGGRSSFHLGTRHPDQVASITAYPGYLRNRQYELLEGLNNTCVIMYVGERDEFFAQRHRDLVRRMEKLGRPVHHEIYRREGHNIDSLWTPEGAQLLMDGIDQRWGCPG